MKEKDLISVIVPVYNTEQYIQRCIDSVLCQTYGDFELLLVDDGSTDQSEEICKRNQMLDNRIFLYNKEHGGLSDTRNYGLDRANGAYIVFLDSDDYIGKNFLEVLYSACFKENASMAIGSIEVVYNKELVCCPPKKFDHKCYTPKEALKIMCINEEFGVSACAKLYKRELFENKRFPKGKIYEDFQVIPYLLEACSKIVYCSDAKMYWYQRRGSITHCYNKENLIWYDVAEKFLKYIDKTYPELHECAMARCANDSIWVMVQRMALTEGGYRDILYARKRCSLYWKEGLKNEYLPIRKKINIGLVLISPRLYIFIYRFYWKHLKTQKEQ